MTWYYKYIGDPTEAFSASNLYMDAMELAQFTNRNDDAALYSRLDRRTGGVHFYFTPEASLEAINFNAQVCATPTLDDIGGLLIGDQTLINRLHFTPT